MRTTQTLSLLSRLCKGGGGVSKAASVRGGGPALAAALTATQQEPGRADDAREAVKHGVNGILVSNHGARQLDGVPATIEVLPEIIEAVEGKIEVFLDGGVRKGTDVLKALAIGARAVFVGRPVIWGLAYQGEQGVKEILQILKEEFHLAMALSGCQNVEAIDRTLVRRNQWAASKM